jgi:hypothetical protein
VFISELWEVENGFVSLAGRVSETFLYVSMTVFLTDSSSSVNMQANNALLSFSLFYFFVLYNLKPLSKHSNVTRSSLAPHYRSKLQSTTQSYNNFADQQVTTTANIRTQKRHNVYRLGSTDWSFRRRRGLPPM